MKKFNEDLVGKLRNGCVAVIPNDNDIFHLDELNALLKEAFPYCESTSLGKAQCYSGVGDDSINWFCCQASDFITVKISEFFVEDNWQPKEGDRVFVKLNDGKFDIATYLFTTKAGKHFYVPKLSTVYYNINADYPIASTTEIKEAKKMDGKKQPKRWEIIVVTGVDGTWQERVAEYEQLGYEIAGNIQATTRNDGFHGNAHMTVAMKRLKQLKQ